ncbi:MAG: GDSL-type esterase/lipase family protein [Planctomycetota bacterium]
MPGIIYHFAGGDAFFTGAALILAGAVLRLFARSRALAIMARLGAAIGAVFIALSSTPLPSWLYVLWAIPVLWLILDGRTNEAPRWRRQGLPIFAALIAVAAAGVELPWHFTPAIDGPRPSRVIVIGDSISVGMRKDITPWPLIVAKERGMNIVDLSRAGEKIPGALERARTLSHQQLEHAVVILEIGGNDMLGKTQGRRFFENLDALLGQVSGPTTTVILLELPLPPFYNRYGKAQRALAAKHNAVLIPKRRFAAILAHPGATIDGLHLSQTGHDLFAEVILDVVRAPR